MVRKTCEYCGEVFMGRRNQRWCSAECRRMGMREYWNERNRSKQEKRNERDREEKEEAYEYALMAVLSLPETRRVELAWLFSQGQGMGNRDEVLRRWLEVGERE